MGLIAIGSVLLAIMAAVLAFQAAKTFIRMPAVLNLPGAVCVFCAVIQLSGWLTHDIFDGHLYMPAPDIPWYSWLLYAGLAILWYGPMALILAKWRETCEDLRSCSRKC